MGCSGQRSSLMEVCLRLPSLGTLLPVGGSSSCSLWSLLSSSSTAAPYGPVCTPAPHFKFVEPSLTVDKWPSTNLTMQHLSMQHLSVQHLSMQHLPMQHLSVQHLSMQHLSNDKFWLFSIATCPVWTKQSNLKLATEPNQNLANSSFY